MYTPHCLQLRYRRVGRVCRNSSHRTGSVPVPGVGILSDSLIPDEVVRSDPGFQNLDNHLNLNMNLNSKKRLELYFTLLKCMQSLVARCSL